MIRILALVVAAIVATWAAAPGRADDRIGVVLMHGKQAGAGPNSPVGRLARALKSAGFRVETPDLPWSESRGFDRTFSQSLAEIDAAAERLRAAGAARIVVAGHSLGAAVALGYGANRSGLAGIVAIAPGHFVDMPGFQRRVGHDYRRARRLIRSGNGDRVAKFRDINNGREKTFEVSARIYLSWYDPDGPVSMTRNAARLRPGVPLLWIFGERDPLNADRGRGYAFDRAPAHPDSAYVVVAGGHGMTPVKGRREIIAWLRRL